MKKIFLTSLWLVLLTAPVLANGLDTARDAALLAQRGAHTQAILQYQKALELRDLDNLQRAKTFYNMGTSYLHMKGKDQEALKAFDEALALTPDDSKIHINKAQALMNLGQTKEQRSVAQKAIALDASNPDAYYLLGMTYLDTAEPQKALDTLAKAIKLAKKNDPAYHLAHARALLGLHAYQKAAKELTEVLKETPFLARAYLYRSIAWRGLKEIKKANADLSIAVKIAPDDSSIRAIYKDARWPERSKDLRVLTKDIKLQAIPKENAPTSLELRAKSEIDVLDCANGWCRIESMGHVVGYASQTSLPAKKK